MMTGYAETYRRSLERPEEFWADAADAIDWERRWDCVLDASRPPFYRWFPGARLNTCWNAVDRHVAARRAPITQRTSGLEHQMSAGHRIAGRARGGDGAHSIGLPAGRRR